MFVLALDPAAAAGPDVAAAGRRHDDSPGATATATAQELFDVVFAALHDGEQLALGVAAGSPAGRQAAIALLTELGHWRPWTAVSTSLPGWRATRSVLVWEIAEPVPDTAEAAVEAFFGQVPAGVDDPDAAGAAGENPLAAAAQAAGLTVDAAELARPVFRVTVGATRPVVG
jgi:hypothetical protein